MMRVKAIKTIVLVLFLLGLGAVIAGGTPAGTEIRNQASASYVDSSGQPQTTTSNEVVTVVQEVYDFTITPDGTEAAPGQTQSAVPGGTVYFPYTVTNNGNTTDTIDLATQQSSNDDFDLGSPQVYLDENCNGQVDPAESTVTSVDLAADESACLIVAGTIPGTATDGQTGLLDLTGTSQGDPALDPDGNGTPGDDNNWAEAVATEKAALTSTKSASPSGEVEPGDTVTYTVEGSNVGGSDAYAVASVVTVDGTAKNGILVSDEIPTNTTYAAGTATGTAGAGTTTVIYQTASGWTATEPAAADVTAVGLLIEDTNYDAANPAPFFPQGAQYELSFGAVVDSGLAAGANIENTAVVKFDSNGDGDADDPGEEVDSNTTTNPVAPTYGVANGPQDDPSSDGSTFTPTYTDPTGKTWNYTEDPDTTDPRDDDAETITDDVFGGDTVYFPFTLQNDGNTPDSFDLALNIVDPDTGDAADPSTWSCQIMASDGTTPISGPVGPIDPGATFDYVVKCSIPADYEETDPNNDAAHIEVTATSEGDPSVTNKVTGIVPDVQSGYDVDAADHGNTNDNDDTNDDPPAQSTDPGETVTIPFDVTNTGHNPDTYDLTTDLPSGWTGTIYPDEDCDGQMDDPTPAPVTDTGLLDPGDTACYVLSVDVPDDQEPVDLDGTPGSPDDNVTITVTSNADPDVKDTISTDIEVNPVADIEFSPDRSGTVTSPGTITYTHTVTNNGNEPADVSFTVDSNQPGWTYQISTDGGNTWTDPASATISDLPAGDSQEVQVRVIVPDGEAVGTVDAADITASATFDSGGTDEDSVTDTTTVVGGELRLEKEVDKTQAEPGENLTYTITASNIGTDDLKKVIISDPLPGYTDFVSVSATTTISGGTVLYSTDGSSWSTTAPTSLSAGQSIYVAVDTNSDNTITDADTMSPSDEIVITFVVQVQ